MIYEQIFASPLGEIVLRSDGEALTGLRFRGQRYDDPCPDAVREELCVFRRAEEWLRVYFSGRIPPEPPPLAPQGSVFRQRVWAELLRIPRGSTVTYGEIARSLGLRMSAQAVGGAVGHNPISLMIPCHRVIGADGSLTGYAGGLWRKERLLLLEGAAFRSADRER